MITAQVHGSEELRHVARLLRQADKVGLKRKLGKAIKQAGDPTLRAVKESALGIQTKGIRRPGAKHPFLATVGSKGTRAAMANATVLESRINEDNPRIRFAVKNSRLPENLRGMQFKFNSEAVWRHPVMGNREVWVGQTGNPWFWPPIRDRIKLFRSEVDQAIAETVQEIGRG